MSGSEAALAAAPPAGGLSGAQIRVTPAEVVFAGVEPGQTYSQRVTLRNVDSKPRAVRIVDPKGAGKAFSLSEHPLTTKLAPGIEIALEVVFRCDDAAAASASDTFSVQAEDGRMVRSFCGHFFSSIIGLFRLLWLWRVPFHARAGLPGEAEVRYWPNNQPPH